MRFIVVHSVHGNAGKAVDGKCELLKRKWSGKWNKKKKRRKKGNLQASILEWHFTILWERAAFNAICQRSCSRTSVVNGKVNGERKAGCQASRKLGDCRSMAHKMSAIIVNSAIIEQVKSVASWKGSRKGPRRMRRRVGKNYSCLWDQLIE